MGMTGVDGYSEFATAGTATATAAMQQQHKQAQLLQQCNSSMQHKSKMRAENVPGW